MIVPPATATLDCTVERSVIVVSVFCSEHLAVGDIPFFAKTRHHITGVSAVPGHRQSVLTNLITDGERRVFSRVPQTSITLDLRITYLINYI